MGLCDRLEGGFSNLMIGISLYSISSVARHFSSDDYHKYIQEASKGIIKEGIGMIRNNRGMAEQGEKAIDLADANYPEISQRYK